MTIAKGMLGSAVLLAALSLPLQAAEPVRFIWTLTSLTVLSFGELTWVTISVQDNTILSLT